MSLRAHTSFYIDMCAVRLDFGLFGTYAEDTTGWTVFQDGNMDYYMIPIIITIIGVVVLLFSLVGLAGMKNVAPAKVMGGLILLLGIACIALSVFFYYEGIIQAIVNPMTDVDAAMKLSPIGTGVIAAIIAGSLMVVSGLMGLATNSSE